LKGALESNDSTIIELQIDILLPEQFLDGCQIPVPDGASDLCDDLPVTIRFDQIAIK
jgi:hypothetical protein